MVDVGHICSAARDKALMEAHQPAIWHFTPRPRTGSNDPAKKAGFVILGNVWISYLWRCEEYGRLAQIAHGVELGPGNKSFTTDCGFVGQSLGVACAEGVQYFIHHQRCIETSQPRADKNYCTFSPTSIFLSEREGLKEETT